MRVAGSHRTLAALPAVRERRILRHAKEQPLAPVRLGWVLMAGRTPKALLLALNQRSARVPLPESMALGQVAGLVLHSWFC
jgi:hypothetical protein